MINVATIATLRPSILRKTYESFTKNLLFTDGFTKDDYQLILNVDPVGDFNYNQEDVLKTAKEFFPNVVWNFTDEASFPGAFNWVWNHTSSDLVFNLEEDWELMYPLSMKKMVSLMEDKKLIHLRLSMFLSTQLTIKSWNRFLDWNGNFFEVPDNVAGTIGWCGHPSINQGWFVRQAIPFIDKIRNPEKQIKWRNKPLWALTEGCRFGAFQPRNSPPAIRDIGRKWMMEHGWRKKGSNKEIFQTWEPTPDYIPTGKVT